MIEAKTPLVEVDPWGYCHCSAGQKVLVQGNAERKERGSRKGSTRSGEEKTCTAGYQSATESLCLGRMGVGKGAPENRTSETENRHVFCRIPASD